MISLLLVLFSLIILCSGVVIGWIASDVYKDIQNNKEVTNELRGTIIIGSQHDQLLTKEQDTNG